MLAAERILAILYAMESVSTILTHIIDSMDEKGRWALPLASVADLLSISELELYGRLYRNMQLSGSVRTLSEVVFTAENVGELVGVLEALSGDDVERSFTQAGLFLPHALRVDAQERLVRRFMTDYILHTVNMDAFDAMLRAARKADLAIDLYLDEYFPVEDTIRQCAREFAHDGGFPLAMEATAADYLDILFRRHILERSKLLSSLVQLLKGRARDTGYVRVGGRSAGNGHDRQDSDESVNGEERDIRRAREVLGIQEGEITRLRIRERYKTLIRRYHPDINPSGLEMSKLINTSYALLLTQCGE